MSFSLSQLTEGIKSRNIGTANRRLLEKWGRTGLLRGLEGVKRENMATMLENQAGQALREASSLGAGTVGDSSIRGFTNIAFPIVRRVFGGLIANELVSIQPMSLPSGLLFYLDYTYGSSVGGDGTASEASYDKGESIYGTPTNPKAGTPALAAGGQYDLTGTGYSKARKKNVGSVSNDTLDTLAVGNLFIPGTAATNTARVDTLKLTTAAAAWYSHDPQITAALEAGANYALLAVPKACLPGMDLTMVQEVSLFAAAVAIAGVVEVPDAVQGGEGILNVRRLNRLIKAWVDKDSTQVLSNAADHTHVLMVVKLHETDATQIVSADFSDGADQHAAFDYVLPSATDSADMSTIVSPAFESSFAAESTIPEIDIKIESIAVTAVTRKLRARWSPELAQDLNAYHNLDAEVELTSILSEQIALEIDQEILEDLVVEATAGTMYWSRLPGNFVNRETGASLEAATNSAGYPEFTGTVSEWYETLVETVNDVSARIHRKTLRGGANFIVVSPEVANLLEFTSGFRANVTADDNKGTVGAVNVGNLSKKWDVFVDPYFPRNVLLVGRKGNSFLESGYVYAPYVPLQVTPTIFGPEDFVPRKGVMTRYAKKMVRPDMYGLCIVEDLV